jgi:O-antigen/teichoic acid export membrane protein
MIGGLKAGIPYFLFGICSTIYYRIGTIMLSRMAPQETVGWFGGAFRLFESMNFPFVLTVAIYPVLSRLWVEVSDGHRKTMQRSLEYVIVLGVPVAAGLILFAHEIVGIFYGMPAYEPSVVVLRVLAAGLLFLYVDMILGTALLSSDRQIRMAFVSLAAIPFSAGVNYLLIPYFQANYQNGGIGVGIATGITEILIMISMAHLLPKGVLRGLRVPVAIKAVAGGGAMAIVALAVRWYGGHWILAAVLAVLAYGAAIFALRIFDAAERQLFRDLIITGGFGKFRHLFGRRGS